MQRFQLKNALVGLIACLGASSAVIAADPFDFGYRVIGADSVRPTLVFNDGRDVFIQPKTDQVVRVVGAESSRQGPYIVVFGLKNEIALVSDRHERVTIIHESQASQQKSLPAASSVPVAVDEPQTEQIAPLAAKAPAEPACKPKVGKRTSMIAVGFAAGANALSPVAHSQVQKLVDLGEVAEIRVTTPAHWMRTVAQRRTDALKDILKAAGVDLGLVKVKPGMTFDGLVEIEVDVAESIPCADGRLIVTSSDGHLSVLAREAPLKDVLARIASELSMEFNVHGDEVEAPVSIEAIAAPLTNVLRGIGAQIENNATIVLRDREIVLQFN